MKLRTTTILTLLLFTALYSCSEVQGEKLVSLDTSNISEGMSVKELENVAGKADEKIIVMGDGTMKYGLTEITIIDKKIRGIRMID